MFRVQLSVIKHNLSEGEIGELARLAHGFVGADLCLFVKEASFMALRRCLKRKLTSTGDVWVRLLAMLLDKCCYPLRQLNAVLNPTSPMSLKVPDFAVILMQIDLTPWSPHSGA